ncbi:MAG: deoxyguanosinetriphosphate triphosphohydrolase [Alphaproteobacteria bacterium]|nr:deoxyguanosinetriphosphate triphosphohydrolase [Alphaproteobacteria bacterium]
MSAGAKPAVPDNAGEPLGHLNGPLFAAPERRAPYAVDPAGSRGRLYVESESPTRTCYQRDRDRIIHSTAFRRLKHKTQVFVQHEGDYYRTRLTHSLEVAQLARSAARVLALDEDLAEAVALAHDLGHTPFGHAGEDALNAATEAFGGFDHNAHGLRLVTKLEHRYADFDGLNLTWETLEGMVKHNGPLLPLGDAAPLPQPIVSFNARWPLDLDTWPSLEAQIAALADDIAYTNHDIDDGLRAGLFTADDLAEAPLVGSYVKAIRDQYGELELSRLIGEIVRKLMGALVADLLDETRSRIAANRPNSADDIRCAGAATAAFSAEMGEGLAALKRFLFAHMYRHPRVMAVLGDAKTIVAELFRAFCEEPTLMPQDWAAAAATGGPQATVSAVRDYIAGMTDRYAVLEYSRVFHTEIRI